MRIVARTLCACAIAGIVSVGCLFPSFDDLEGSADAAKPKKDGAATSPATSSTTGTPPPASTTEPSDGAVFENWVSCGERNCPLPPQRCCMGLLGPVGCMDANQQAACDQPFALWIACDGKKDCPGAQVCCRKVGASTVGCEETCDSPDTLVCNGDSVCPPGRTCSVDLTNGYTGCTP